MYRLIIEDEKYNRFFFIFDSMEELSVFANTVLAKTTNENVKITITKEVCVDAETL
jgi:hypothetical protein